MSTQDRLIEFVRAEESVKSLRSQLNSAECRVANLKNELGKFLSPTDAKDGETFQIWVNGESAYGIKGDVMLEIKRISNHNFEIKRRGDAKEKVAA